MKKLCILFLLPICSLSAEYLHISQIDANRLVVSQEIDLYLDVSGDDGRPIRGLTAEDFLVYEGAKEGQTGQKAEIISLETDAHQSEGLEILLLVDNSGSMYDKLDGEATETPEETRMYAARRAIERFIGNAFGPGDSISLASFNSEFFLHTRGAEDPSSVHALLSDIRRPTGDEMYTDLYRSLSEAADLMSPVRGRRLVLVLSDGENYPLPERDGAPEAPDYKSIIERYRRRGISLYAIHLGDRRDRHLGEIALQTGGSVYRADDAGGLYNVYSRIREKLENEYRLSYRASMFSGEKTFVRLSLADDSSRLSEGFYYSSQLFGRAMKPFPLPLLGLSVLSFLIWLLFYSVRLRKRNRSPLLEVIDRAYGTRVGNKTLALDGGVTRIGSKEGADLGIAGRFTAGDELTVSYSDKEKAYTICEQPGLLVNNQPVGKSRLLEGGDLIQFEGTTIVFHEADESEQT